MKEIENLLLQSLKKALEVAEKTGEFALEQAPELLQQFYTWHIVSDIFWIIFSVALFLIANYSEFFGVYLPDTGSDPTSALTWVGFIIGCIVSLIVICVHVYNLLYIIVAPKLYLIEYLLGKV